MFKVIKFFLYEIAGVGSQILKANILVQGTWSHEI